MRNLNRKKLELNRDTVRLLQPEELRQAQGGIVSTDTPNCTTSDRCASRYPRCA